MSKKVNIIILAAGSSLRMNGKDKVLEKLPNGLKVITCTLSKFKNISNIENIVVVVRKDIIDEVKNLMDKFEINKKIFVIEGGPTRTKSFLQGYRYLKNNCEFASDSYCLIHDGARPLISEKCILNCLEDAFNFGSAAVGIKINETVKKTDIQNYITKTVKRDDLFLVQTPQVFRVDILEKAVENALNNNLDFTDDCQLIEAIDEKVFISNGEKTNIKITTQEDLELVENILKIKENKLKLNFRVGHGYDVHKLVSGRDFVLCGVKIESDKGLLGHSDGDVGIHAIIDSILGALGLRDIGVLFPDNDEKYKDIDSKILLKNVYDIVKEKSFIINNIDCTIILQKPKISKYIVLMEETISKILNISKEQINIKATTEEELGFTGKGLGVKAIVVTLMVKN